MGLQISKRLTLSLHCITSLFISVIILDFLIISLFNVGHQHSESILLNFQRPASWYYTWKRQAWLFHYLGTSHDSALNLCHWDIILSLFFSCAKGLYQRPVTSFLTAIQQQRFCVLFVWINTSRSEQGLGGS